MLLAWSKAGASGRLGNVFEQDASVNVSESFP